MVTLTDSQQESKSKAENHEVSEDPAEDKQAAGAEHEGRRPLAFAAVEARLDERPYLIENPGSCQEDGAQNGEFEPDDIEGFHRLDLDQVLFLVTERFESCNSRLADEIPKRVGVSQTQGKSHPHANQGANDAIAELFQVLEERHAEHAIIVLVAAAAVAAVAAVAARWRRRSLAAPTGPPRKRSY